MIEKKSFIWSRRMNWRSPRFLFPLIAVVLLLIAGIVIVYLRSNSSAAITIAWQSPPTSFTQQDQQSIQTALQTALLASNLSDIAGHEYTIIDAQRQGNWANFAANERVSQDAQPIATEPLFFLAHLQGTDWNVWLPGSPGFCDELKQTPDTLLDPIDKHYFSDCYQ